MTYLGFKWRRGSCTTSRPLPRRIELNPNINPDQAGQVAGFQRRHDGRLSKVTINPPVAVVVTPTTSQTGGEVRLSISEPDDESHSRARGITPYDEANGGYTPQCWDVPFDIKRRSLLKSQIMNDGRSDGLKVGLSCNDWPIRCCRGTTRPRSQLQPLSHDRLDAGRSHGLQRHHADRLIRGDREHEQEPVLCPATGTESLRRSPSQANNLCLWSLGGSPSYSPRSHGPQWASSPIPPDLTSSNFNCNGR